MFLYKCKKSTRSPNRLSRPKITQSSSRAATSQNKKIPVYTNLNWCLSPWTKLINAEKNEFGYANLLTQKLSAAGFCFTSDCDEAKIIVIPTDDMLHNQKFRNKKKFLLTMDPRHSQLQKKLTFVDDVPVLVSNCYANTIFKTNYGVGPSLLLRPPPKSSPWSFADICHKWNKTQKSTIYMGQIALHSPHLNLMKLRTQAAFYGWSEGIVDIVSRSLPNIICNKPKDLLIRSTKASWQTKRSSPIPGNKINCLKENYLFNLTFENSNIPYYVTEKLWQAFHGGCLPIYYSNDTVYETFPKGCFIDYRDFSSFADLYQYIRDMSVDEYLERINLGLAFISRTEELQEIHQQEKERHIQHICKNLAELQEIKA